MRRPTSSSGNRRSSSGRRRRPADALDAACCCGCCVRRFTCKQSNEKVWASEHGERVVRVWVGSRWFRFEGLVKGIGWGTRAWKKRGAKVREGGAVSGRNMGGSTVLQGWARPGGVVPGARWQQCDGIKREIWAQGGPWEGPGDSRKWASRGQGSQQARPFAAGAAVPGLCRPSVSVAESPAPREGSLAPREGAENRGEVV